MILKCPNCSSKFELPAAQLAPEGKKVKCSKCAEVWFQMPDPDELDGGRESGAEDESFSLSQNDEELSQIAAQLSSIEEEMEKQLDDSDNQPDDEDDQGDQDGQDDHDELHNFTSKYDPAEAGGEENDTQFAIPDAIKPKDDGDGDASLPVRQVGRSAYKKGYVWGALAAFVLFCILTVWVLMSSQTLVRILPVSAALYDAIGYDVAAPGDGLVFDGIQAVARDEESIQISGHILNLDDKAVSVPFIKAVIQDANGAILLMHHVKPPEQEIEMEGVLPFNFILPAGFVPGSRLSLSFVLNTESSSKDKSEDESVEVSPHPPEESVVPEEGEHEQESPALKTDAEGAENTQAPAQGGSDH